MNPEIIFLEDGAESYPLTRRILDRVQAPVVRIADYRQAARFGHTENERVKNEKRALAIGVKKGEMVKAIGRCGCSPFPEFHLVHALNCSMDCAYCFLHYYFENEVPTIFVNTAQLFEEIEAAIRATGRCRFHAGELSDALVFDHLTDLSSELIELFRRHPQAELELRTKSDEIERLLKTQPSSNVIVSWSMNPQSVAAFEEDTLPVYERTECARQVQHHGYVVGVRLDPIVHTPDWKRDYDALLRHIFDRLDPTRLDSVSLGTFRFHRKLAEVMRRRGYGTELLLDEFVSGSDGKYRYFSSIRLEMYRWLRSRLAALAPSVRIDWSMEDEWVRDAVEH